MSARIFLSLFGSVFFLFAGYSLFLNSAGIKLVEMGISPVTIGLLNAAFFVGGAASAITAHLIISRVGHIRSFGVFGAIFAIGALSHLMNDNLILWGVLRVILGYCYFSLLMVVESWFTSKSSIQKRAKVLAIYEIMFYAASGVGITLLSLKLQGGNIFALSAILIMASVLPVGLTKLEEPEIPPLQHVSLPHVFSIVPLAWIGSFLAGVMINGFFTMASVFMLHQNYSVRQIAIYLGCAMVGGFCAQMPAAHLSNRYGRRRAILVSASLPCIATFIGVIAMMIFKQTPQVHYITAFVSGCGLFTLYSLSLARANDVIPNNMNTVEVNRSLLFVYGLGSLVGPILLGLVMSHAIHYGFYSIYVITSFILIMVAWKGDHVPAEERSVYVGMPTASSTIVGELDPRNNEKTDIPFDSETVQQHIQTQKECTTMDNDSETKFDSAEKPDVETKTNSSTKSDLDITSDSESKPDSSM